MALIGLIPLEQILDELPSSPKEFIPWIQDLKKFVNLKNSKYLTISSIFSIENGASKQRKNYAKNWWIESNIGSKLEMFIYKNCRGIDWNKNWRERFIKFQEKNKFFVKGKVENILNKKCPADEAESLMENKISQKTNDSFEKGDDKNKEANSEIQKEISDEQQPTTSKTIAISEENVSKF